MVEKIKGEIIIKYYPARTITSHTIQAHIQQMTSLGFKPDLIIVDYADLMSANARTDARYQELGAVYEELRGLAGELQVPIWTASQTQRSALQDEVIQADKIAESYSKIMTADLVVSISRKLEDKVHKTGRAHIIKNRFGGDGQTFPMIIDAVENNVLNSLSSLVQNYSTQENIQTVLVDQVKNELSESFTSEIKNTVNNFGLTELKTSIENVYKTQDISEFKSEFENVLNKSESSNNSELISYLNNLLETNISQYTSQDMTRIHEEELQHDQTQ